MSPSRGRVAVLGSANLDLVVGIERIPQGGETLLAEARGRFAGGKGLNQALAAARSGAETLLCAAVGEDTAGDHLQQTLSAAGVAGGLRRIPGVSTGTAYVLSLPDSENSIIVTPGANALLSVDDTSAAVSGADVVLAQLEIPIEAAAGGLSAARRAGTVTILNAAPADAAILPVLRDVDFLIVNETECAELGGVSRLLAAGATAIVRTIGARGAELHRDGRQTMHVAGFSITPADTTGAGDAFCGAFAAAVASGLPLEAAMIRGSAAGAITAQHLGANSVELSAAAIDAMVMAR